MTAVRVTFYSFVIVMLMGCSLITKLFDSPQLTPSYHILMPESAVGQLNLYQEISLLAHDTTAQFHLAIELNNGYIQLIGLNLLGQRLFDIRYEELNVKTAYQGAKPNQYNEKQLVRDIQWIFWPLHILETTKENSWLFFDAAQTRLIYFENQHIATIQKIAGKGWNGEYIYTNHIDQYELQIKSISYE